MKIKVNIGKVILENPEKDYIPIKLKTKRENIIYGLYKVPKTNLGVIWVGSIVGVFDTPSKGLYLDLSKKLMENNISSLRIQNRNPTNLEESVYDLIAGIKFLESEKISKIALKGHFVGGADDSVLPLSCSRTIY